MSAAFSTYQNNWQAISIGQHGTQVEMDGNVPVKWMCLDTTMVKGIDGLRLMQCGSDMILICG